MSINFLSKLNDDKSNLPGFASGALGVLPVGLAVFAAAKRLQSNTPIKASHIMGTNAALGQMGQAISSGLHASYKTEDANLEKVTEQFMKSDAFEKMMQKTQERNAVVMSLLTTIEDPSAGFSQDALKNTREALLRIANESTDNEEARSIMKAAITTLHESASEQTQKRFGSRLREFSKVAGDLVPPAMDFSPGVVFNPIQHATLRNSSALEKLTNDSGRASLLRARYDRLSDIVGRDIAQDAIELASVDTGMGQKAIVARVFSGKGNNKQFVRNITLLGNATGRKGPAFIPMGENAQTFYAAPRGVIKQEHMSALNTKYGPGGWGPAEARRAGYLHGIEDRQIENFGEFVQRGEGRLFLTREKRQALNSIDTEVMIPAPRILSHAGGNRGLRKHVYASLSENMNYVVADLNARSTEAEKEAAIQGALTKRLVKRKGKQVALKEGFDVGGTRVSDIVEGRQHATLQLRENGAITSYRPGIRANRLNTPGISRLEQSVGREGMYVRGQSAVRKAGRYSTYDMGANVAPIGWRATMTGGVNKVGVFDITMGAGHGFLARTEGSGQAWATGAIGDLLTHQTIPIFDPKSHDQLSTKLFNFIQQTGGGDLHVLPDGRLRHATSGEVFGRTLGVGPAGLREVHLDPRATSINLSVARSTQAYGKNLHHVSVNVTRTMDQGKLFSPRGKLTVVQAEHGSLGARLAKDYGIGHDFLKREFGVAAEDVLYGSGDQLKKAPSFLIEGMIGAMGLSSRVKDPTRFVEGRLRRLGNRASPLGAGEYGNAIDIIMEHMASGMKSGRVSAAGAANTLTAIYHGSGLAALHHAANPNAGIAPTDQFYKGTEFAIDPLALEARFKHHFGEQGYQQLLSQQGMRSGIFSSGMTFKPGTGVGDYGRGRGSMEPRILELASQKLRSAGMSNAEVSNFMIDIYKRKIGGEAGMKVVRPLERMMASQLGGTLPNEVGKTLNITEFLDVLAKHDSFASYLKTQSEDVFLDLGQGGGKNGSIISHAAGEVFGGQRTLRFAAAPTIDLMKGTEIKQAAGMSLESAM